MDLPFVSRQQAGIELAKGIKAYASQNDMMILALVRGGVVIGKALADALQLPLFPYIVRKLGHPGHREYGLGAIAEGGATYLDETGMLTSGVSWEEMEPVIEEETKEL